MQKITAYKCDFCNKFLRSKMGIKLHESKCFYNPASKSCVTCEHLCLKNCLNGKPLTELEERILNCQIKGIYHLYAEPLTFCDHHKCILDKLRTQCKYHK